MGVPKFYRWISERYPTLSEVISDSQIPEFDNLYLDMNGIIHQCSHPNDDDVTFRITEEQIFSDIFDYIEKLFMIIRPRKVFFMAVDGVAPRAKMNQQRARRFMSARTAQEQLDKALKKGEEIPDEKRFDSNCITPGTPFMTRLNTQLNAFVSRKIQTDSRWQNMRIVLSGHNVPGEGEHKIMDFIRAERATPDYDPNTRHCMYGLDADLIMLGICSHEPHFSLLREEVKFGRVQRPKKGGPGGAKKAAEKPEPKRCAPSEITFHLLHLSLMREYLYWEFHGLKDKLSFPYDMERIADDWILMCFLVGNDFIPHLPHVHIHDDGLPFLYDAYRKVLPTMDGYINESGYLNLKRFETFLKAVADNDKDHFLKIMEDKSFMDSKRAQQPQARRGLAEALEILAEEMANEQPEEMVPFEDSDMSSCSDEEREDDGEETEESGDAAFVSSDEEALEPETTQKDSDSPGIPSAADALATMSLDDPAETEFAREMALAEFAPMDEKDFESSVAACWSRTIGNSFKRHKKTYYREKLKFGNISKEQLRGQSEGYVRAIQWVLHYYYHGCVSWNWYFEHHYAPYISDVTDFSTMSMNFELSKPFHPFEQLLAVLPAASAECLPPPLRELMISSESPIGDFYPTDFKTDLNGKKNDWEAVVLIPFIDETRLLEAIKTKEPQLTAEEKKRNEYGQHALWTTETEGGQPKAKQTLLDMDLFRIPADKVVWGLLPNVKLDVFFPGFPTMKHLPHTGQLKCVNVSVFQQSSKKHSMVLKIGERNDQDHDLSTLATDLIGKEVCVEWPVLKMGIVDHVVSLTHRYNTGKDGSLVVEELEPEEKKLAQRKLQDLRDRQMARYAIDCGQPKAVAYVKRFLGVNYEARQGTLHPRKQYGGVEDAMAVPVNLVVTNITVEEGRRLEEIPVEKAYPPKSRVFVMGPNVQAFGYPCLVDTIEDADKPSCRVRVMCALTAHPDLTMMRNNIASYSLGWFDGFQTSKRTGISNRLIGRITGTIFLVDGDRKTHEDNHHGVHKLNVGANLKFTKRNQEVPDYSRRTRSGVWQYSLLTVGLLQEYRRLFPEIFKCLEQSTSYDDVYYSEEIWEDKKVHEQRLAELREFLGALPSASVEKQEAGQLSADCMLLSHLETAVKNTQGKTTMFKGSVMPNLIWKPDLYDGKVRPDPDADFQLLDRVVNTSQSTVPFGQLGTVIGVVGDKIEVLFDKEFKGGYKKRELASIARVPIPSVINITYGKERKGKPRPVVPELPEDRPSTSRGPRLTAGREFSPRKEESPAKKGSRKEVKEPPTGVMAKLLVGAKEVGQVKVLQRETKEPLDEKKAVEDQLSTLLGLNGKKEEKVQTRKNKGKDDSDIVPAVLRILKRGEEMPPSQQPQGSPKTKKEEVENKPPSVEKEPKSNGNEKWAPKKSHQEKVFTPSKPQVPAIDTSVPPPPLPSALQQATVTQPQKEHKQLIPTSNVDPMKLTDLRPSTVASFKRGGGAAGRGGRRQQQQQVHHRGSASSDSVPIKQPPPAAVASATAGGNGKKQRKCRLAATFPTA